MSIQNPRNLYGGDAVVLNSNPYANFAINQLAQKQAKADALDRYFSEQNSKLNPEGLAPEEVKALLAEKNNFQTDYQKNKGAIHKNDPNALTNIYQHLNKMNEIISNGKAKVADSKNIERITSDPNKADLLNPQSMQAMNNAHSSIYKIDPKTNAVTRNDYDPIDNPTGYKAFDFNQHLFHDKPYEAKDMEDISKKYWGAIKPDSYTTVNTPLIGDDGHPSKTQMMQHQEGVLSDKTAKNAYQGLINMHDQNPRLAYTVDKGHPFDEMRAEHADDFNTLNAVNQKILGKDITSNGELYAAQEYLTHNNPHVTVPKLITNQDAKTAIQQGFQRAQQQRSFGQQDYLAGLKNNYSKALIDYKKTGDAAEQESILNKYIDNSYDVGTNRVAGSTVNSVNVDGKNYSGKIISVPISVRQDFPTSTDANGKPVGADAFMLTNDKKTIIPIEFKKDDKGNPIKGDNGNIALKSGVPQDIQTLKTSLAKALLTKKQAGAEVTNEDFGVPTATPQPRQVAKPQTTKVKKSAKDYGL